jgi:hypothetical protein
MAAEGATEYDRPGPRSLRKVTVVIVAAVLAAGVLALDAATPRGYGAGFFFIVPFLVIVFGLPRISPYLAAAATVLLSAAGLFLSPPGIPVAIALAGRVAFWALVVGIAVFVDRYRSESRERRALDDRYRALFWRHYTAVLVIDPAGRPDRGREPGGRAVLRLPARYTPHHADHRPERRPRSGGPGPDEGGDRRAAGAVPVRSPPRHG